MAEPLVINGGLGLTTLSGGCFNTCDAIVGRVTPLDGGGAFVYGKDADGLREADLVTARTLVSSLVCSPWLGSGG
jgi:hypothetical protein